MKIDEIVKRLEPWKRRHDAMMAQYETLHSLTGSAPDCDLLKPVFEIWEAYTIAVGELIGDKGEWLQWYEQECDMGRKPRAVKSDSGIELRVRTLRQLARVIAW